MPPGLFERAQRVGSLSFNGEMRSTHADPVSEQGDGILIEGYNVLGRVDGASVRPWVLALLLFVFLPFGTSSRADWVNLGGAEVAPNIAEIYVQDDGVRVVLEVFVGDLQLFSDLLPAEWMAENGIATSPDADRLARFSEQGLSIRPDGGTPLVAERVEVDRRLRVDRASQLAGTVDPYSGRMLPRPPDDPRVLYIVLLFPFQSGRPEMLQISPPVNDTGATKATIGMVAFHRAVPVIDFRYLSAPATLHLDWNDPWYSRFDNQNLTRHHNYPRMSFLYAEPYEIRHEALVRVRDAAELVGQKVSGATLDGDAAQDLARRVEREISARTPISIDGTSVQPDFDRSAFMRIGMRGLEILPPGEAVNVDADILGLIWSVPTDGLPKQAQLEWTWFDEAAPEVAGYAIDAAGPFLSPLSPDDPVLVWTNHFKKPPYPEIAAVTLDTPSGVPQIAYVLGGIAALAGGLVLFGVIARSANAKAMILTGAAVAVLSAGGAAFALKRQATRLPALDMEQMTNLTTDLLNNVYRAFDFRLEDQVYDRLALTLDGEILEQVYLDQRKSLRIERAGGADARVEKLEVTAVDPSTAAPSGALGLRADWIIRGSVGHWGHVHRRANRYEANLTVKPVGGTWKILDFDVLSQERLQ